MSQIMLEDTDSQLAQLIRQARAGEEVVIVHDSTPIAQIVPLPQASPKLTRLGYGAGKDDILYMADDFDAPLKDFKDYMCVADSHHHAS